MYYMALSRITQCRVESTSSPHSISRPRPRILGTLVPLAKKARVKLGHQPLGLKNPDWWGFSENHWVYIIQVSVFIRIHEYEHHLMIWGLIVTLVAIFLSTKTWREPTVHGDSHQNMLISSPKLETSIHCKACWGTYIRNYRHI